ncbi:MAG: four helix bundle protein [Acidobacteriaceae bacterium]
MNVEQSGKFRCKAVVWQRAVDLCVAIYELTRKFPREEIYGITQQIRRAGVSIPSNIAEGYARGSREQYRQFLSIAQGSCSELQTQLVIANRLKLAPPSDLEQVETLASEVGKMLTSILARLRATAKV